MEVMVIVRTVWTLWVLVEPVEDSVEILRIAEAVRLSPMLMRLYACHFGVLVIKLGWGGGRERWKVKVPCLQGLRGTS